MKKLSMNAEGGKRNLVMHLTAGKWDRDFQLKKKKKFVMSVFSSLIDQALGNSWKWP